MKRVSPLILILIIFYCGSLFAANGKITISGTEWAPYTGKELPGKGFFTEITVNAFEAVGYKTQIKLVPWKRALINTKFGRFDALMGASYTKERTSYFAYPKYAWKNKMHLFSSRDKEGTFKTFKDLCPAKIGILRGSFYTERLKEVGCLKLEEATQVAQNIKKLSKKRIQYMVDSKDAVLFFLKQNPKYNDSIKIMNPPFETDKIYTVISKKNPDYQTLVNAFDKGIKIIKQDGRYKAILKKHGY